MICIFITSSIVVIATIFVLTAVILSGRIGRGR